MAFSDLGNVMSLARKYKKENEDWAYERWKRNMEMEKAQQDSELDPLLKEAKKAELEKARRISGVEYDPLTRDAAEAKRLADAAEERRFSGSLTENGLLAHNASVEEELGNHRAKKEYGAKIVYKDAYVINPKTGELELRPNAFAVLDTSKLQPAPSTISAGVRNRGTITSAQLLAEERKNQKDMNDAIAAGGEEGVHYKIVDDFVTVDGPTGPEQFNLQRIQQLKPYPNESKKPASGGTGGAKSSSTPTSYDSALREKTYELISKSDNYKKLAAGDTSYASKVYSEFKNVVPDKNLLEEMINSMASNWWATPKSEKDKAVDEQKTLINNEIKLSPSRGTNRPSSNGRSK